MLAAQRTQARDAWLNRTLTALGRSQVAGPQALTAEASTRRFSRIMTDQGSLVLMDAPPETENNAQFRALSPWLRRHGLHAPLIHAEDAHQGFMLIEDLGDALFGQAVAAADPEQRQRLYALAITTLIRFQRAGQDAPPPGAPAYDEARLTRELGLFGEHFARRFMAMEPPENIWQQACAGLMAAALTQPRSCVYLDYHSRNLLLLDDGTLGLVDFQDIHVGPVCYDLVSLLRDCYLRWPQAEVAALRARYLEQARAAGIEGVADTGDFERGFDLCGVQRHLKALGIFARVALDRGQTHYLDDMPRVLEHLLEVMPHYPETADLGHWLLEAAAPNLEAAIASARSP
ncbi:MAG: phosphotransferase [Gammaproteobacteria bacterium]|nr:phosphotransferase [Gammaproteobacteria bacterium]